MTSPNALRRSGAPTRLWHIDLLKLVAANAIVLHHLSAYGPIADAVATAWPTVMAWLYNDARMAVQVFLVVGGYLAARGLSRLQADSGLPPVRAMLQRYIRLVLPYLAALLLAVVGAALARQWMTDEAIPDAPELHQWLAHMVLLQDLLAHDALSAGVWYVAIDFQLFCVMVCLVWVGGWVGRRSGASRQAHTAQRITLALVLGLMGASLFFFNRDDTWDVWALYFFGAYGLGAAAHWVARSKHAGRCLMLLALIGLVALWVDFRERIAIALGVALLLGAVQARSRWQLGFNVWAERLARPLDGLLPTSYALFLVHFPICLLGNALFVRLEGQGAVAGIAALLGTWAVSVGLGVLFHHRVERPLAAAVQRRSAAKAV
ncbi:MAG: acyltransferase [Pseudomonadota bacterium]